MRFPGVPGSILSIVVAVLVAALLPVAAAEEDRAPPPAAPEADAAMVGLQYLAQLPARIHEPGFADAAIAAQLEQQGLLSSGTTAALAQQDMAPENRIRDFHLVCDLNGDGYQDIIANEYQGRLSRSVAYSGKDDEKLWVRDHLMVLFPPLDGYARPGTNPPRIPDNIHLGLDGNADGVCDLLTMGYAVYTVASDPLLGSFEVDEVHVILSLVSGVDAETIWQRIINPVTPEYANVQEPLFNAVVQDVVTNFPTGFHLFESDTGPKFVFKTTDLIGTHANSIFSINGDTINYDDVNIVEHVMVGDATSGQTIWTRDIPAGSNVVVGATDITGGENRVTNYTWITGTTDLAGSTEHEVVLDQFSITTPRGNEIRSPITGEYITQNARGMNVLALRGEDGGDLWRTSVFEETLTRVNALTEENFPILLWTHAQILPDATGDNRSDILPTFLTREAAVASTPNARFIMHLHPLNGADGDKLWPDSDVRVQGWGFAASLTPAGAERPLWAVGSVDIPTTPIAGARFPAKDTRIAVIDARDGTKVWEYNERFMQDSYLGFGLTLQQFRETLAPHDWNGDGVRDVVSPGRYEGPGEEQLLLSTQNHTYQVLSGVDGDVLHRLSVWGANGAIVSCGAGDDKLTAITGHSRRLEVTRLNVTGGRPDWHHIIWIDPTIPRAASAGFDLMFLQTRCGITDRGETFFVANAGMRSIQRGDEYRPIHGFAGASEIRWQYPPLNLSEPIADFLELTARHERPPSETPLAIGLAIGPLLPGAGLGFLGLALRARRARKIAGMTLVSLIAIGVLAPAVPALPLDAGIDAAMTGDETPAVDSPLAPTTTPPSRAEARASLAAGPVPVGAPTDVLPALADEPFVRYLHGLDSDAASNPAHRGALFSEYMGSVGFDAPYENMRPLGENESIHYTYGVGDIDADGTDDVALNSYCADIYGCYESYDILQDPVTWLTKGFIGGAECGPRHRLTAQSGADGHEIWNRSLWVPHPIGFIGCAQEFVVGAPKLPSGDVGILVYRHSELMVTWPFPIHSMLEHSFHMIDAKTGKDIWTRTFVGNFTRDWIGFPPARVSRAENMVVNPILQEAPRQGVPFIAGDTETALFLQGVSFERLYSNGWINPPLLALSGPVRLLESYQPREWAARLDLATGNVIWRVDTFQPQAARSVLPLAVQRPYPDSYTVAEPRALANYWLPGACCFDLTGDKVPELVFHTVEWSLYPSMNNAGPFLLDMRYVVHDGATGRQLYTQILEKDSKLPRVVVVPNAIGDATGDGIGDVLLDVVHPGYEFHHYLSLRNGPDGAEVWRYDSTRDLRAWVLGDADGDGGNDFLMMRWWNHTTYGPLVNQPLTNVTGTLMSLVRGATGDERWRIETYTAPLDILVMYQQYVVNGVPDINGDGVGDFFTDDPIYLPDLSVIHRQTFRSGVDASPLFDYPAAGGFAFPTSLGDVTGDGTDDVGLLSGDVVDMWFTAIDGKAGQEVWSRRIMAPRLSNYVTAFPRLHVERLEVANTSAPDFFVNFHLRVTTRVFNQYVIYFSNNGFAQGQNVNILAQYPQFAVYDGLNGTVPWATPGFYEANLTRLVRGATPASAVYDAAIKRQSDVDLIPYVQLSTGQSVAIASASFSVGLLGCIALFARRFRP